MKSSLHQPTKEPVDPNIRPVYNYSIYWPERRECPISWLKQRKHILMVRLRLGHEVVTLGIRKKVVCLQRWKKGVTSMAPPVQIFHSCASFFFARVVWKFFEFLCNIWHFYLILHNFERFLCAYFSDSKLVQCYFVSLPSLCVYLISH